MLKCLLPKCLLCQNVYYAKMSTPKMSTCRDRSRGSFGQEIYNFQGTFGEHLRIPYIFLLIICPGWMPTPFWNPASCKNTLCIYFHIPVVFFVSSSWYYDICLILWCFLSASCVDCAMGRLWFLTVCMSLSWCHDKADVMIFWLGSNL